MSNLHNTSVFASMLLSLAVLVSACDEKEVVDDGQAAGDGDATDTEESADQHEACGEIGETRACQDGEGTQFCDDIAGEIAWGDCLVDFACMPGDSQSCFPGDPDFGSIMQGCQLVDGVPAWDENACNTPLVLSFDAAPIQMLASSAAFDIAGAGMCLSTDWPAAHNPWLAIDLDKNGFIDGGHELFGSGSVLGSGRHAANGFVALTSLDSNHDGKISAADERFGEILVWRDEDGDKLSLPFELSALTDEGVQSIDLGYELREQCDERGNCGRERSSFEFVGASGRVQVGEVVDVYLACQ